MSEGAYFHAPGCSLLLQPTEIGELLPLASPSSVFAVTERIARERDRLLQNSVAAWSVPYGSPEAFLKLFDVVVETNLGEGEWKMVARPVPKGTIVEQREGTIAHVLGVPPSDTQLFARFPP